MIYRQEFRSQTLLTHFSRRALEAGHTVGVSFDVYRSTITFHGRPDMLGRFEGIWAVLICGGGITLLVQVR